MKNQITEQQNRMDENYGRESGWLHGVVLRLARKSINRVAKTALSRAYERGIINSNQLHHIAAILDRILWPERYKRERGSVIQSGNVCGGDIAGGDINK